MERPCYRCGTQIEEQTPFCSSCGAPQIKVSVRSSVADPATPPLPPGTPGELPPLNVPVVLRSGEIHWNKFLRIALPWTLLSAVGWAYFWIVGIAVLLSVVIFAVKRYRREQASPLSAGQGARMGAVMGLISATAGFILFAIPVVLDPADLRRQLVFLVQQKTGGNPDPYLQRFAQWVVSDQGLWVFLGFALLLLVVFTVVLASIAGALSASASSTRERR
jgi:hypothetical protein